MHETRSATELTPVLVEPRGIASADVWLRADIMEDVDDEGGHYWVAHEVHGVVAGVPDAGEIEADFDAWWDRLEEASLSDADKFEKLRAQVMFTALMTDTEVS